MRASTFLPVAFLLVLGLAPALAKDLENTNPGAKPPAAAPAAPGGVATDESAAAGAVAQRFYDDYVNRYLRSKGKKPGLGIWMATRPDVSPQFKRLFAAADAKAKRSEMGGWDADPIINAQDYPDDGNMVVKGLNVNGLKAVVTMNWQRGMDAPVQVTLLRFPEGWKIHGIGGMVAK